MAADPKRTLVIVGENGIYKLTQEDWETYDGLDYAASPDLASRNQQIAVAQKVLAADAGRVGFGASDYTPPY